MRLQRTQERTDKYHFRYRGNVEVKDPFGTTNQKITRTLVSGEDFPGIAGMQHAIDLARNLNVATRTQDGAQELTVVPRIKIERAALRVSVPYVGHLAVFMTEGKIPFDPIPSAAPVEMPAMPEIPTQIAS